jgi:type IV secretion system protein VirB4
MVPATMPQPLAPLLPWGAQIQEEPAVIVNKSGLLQTTMAYRGPDTAALSAAELGVQALQLNSLFKRLGSGMALWAEAQRVEVPEYPPAAWPVPIAALVDEEQRQRVSQEQHFESQYYLTIGWQPPGLGQSRWFERALFRGRRAQTDDTLASHCEEFTGIAQMAYDLFTPIMARVQWAAPAETLTYLESCCSTKRYPVAVPPVPLFLDSYLASQDLLPGTDPQLGGAHLRCVTVRPTIDASGFPETTTPVILQALDTLPFQYRYSVRWLALSKAEARRVLESLFRKWSVREKSVVTIILENLLRQQSTRLNPVALARKAEVEAAKAALLQDEIAYGFGTVTVVVWDNDRAAVVHKARQIEAVLNRQGFIAKVEDLNAVEAWLGTLPGDVSHQVRRPILSSLNIAHLVPHSAVWGGQTHDAHLNAPPVCYGTTTGSTPFRVVLHQRADSPGHTFVVGPTRSGKSGGLAFLALQFLRYAAARVYLFDKQEALRGVTLAVGGHHYRIGTDGHGGIQPLANIDQGHTEQRWAAGWVADVLTQEGLLLTPHDQEHLWEALCSLATFPQEYRTLSGLQGLLPIQHLRQALAAFCQGGPYGALFDVQDDALTLTPWTCFELQELLGLPRAVAPYLSCVFHRMEATFTGGPVLVGIDEAWTAFDSPVFAPKVRELLKAWGKANVSVLLSTQDLVDSMHREQLWQAIQSACQTWIYLPNAAALREEVAPYYRRCGLNEEQIHTIATATPRQDYYYSCAEGSQLFALPLGPIARAICASSSKEDLRLLDHLWATEGPEGIATGLLRAKGLDWAADLLAGAALKETSDVDDSATVY